MDSSVVSAIISAVVSVLVSLLASFFILGQYKNKVDILSSWKDKLEEEMKELRKELTQCTTIIDERTSQSPKKYVSRKSPLALTKEGKELIQKMSGDKYIYENQAELVAEVKKMNPKSAYDIQEFSRKVIEELNQKDEFIPFKDFAYNEGLELETVNLVMGVFLRDIALPILGYTLKDVEDSEPKEDIAQEKLPLPKKKI